MRKLLFAFSLVVATAAVGTSTVEAVSNCRTRASTGRLFTGVCQGSGLFYVRAVCKDDDGQNAYYASGSVVSAPMGVSEGYCKWGWHPGSTWIVT